MAENLEMISFRYELVISETYKHIRAEQINHIIQLSSSQTDPVLLKGMLKLIHDTDKWRKDLTIIKERKANIQNGK